MAMLEFNATYYLQQNPDVAFAISRGTIGSALEHFNNFGRFEGRNPNAYFDVTYYLTANPDVAAARVNPLDHFLNFGAAEGRFTNAAADAAIDTDGNNLANEFDATAYLAANPDVAANVGAGKEFATAYQHYVEFGQFEIRTGVPAGGPFTNTGTAPNTGSTFAFTSAVGEILNGTTANDTFTGVVGTGGTFNVGDQLNGGAGTDTLNLTIADGATAIPSGASVTGVEVINLNYAGGTLGALNSSTFAGATQIWQIDNDATSSDFSDITVANGVTAGFRGNVAVADAVTAAAGVTAVSIALDGVATTSTVTVGETTANGLSSVSISGSVVGTPAVVGVDANGDGDFTDVGDTAPVAASNTLTVGSTATDVDTLNLSISSNTTVVITALDDLNTFNASGSTGNLTVALGTPDELTSARFGSGNDTVSLTTSSLAAGTITVDLGAGNDVLTLNAVGNTADTAINVTLGTGNDTIVVGGTLTNITDATKFAGDIVTVADFSASSDVLNLSALGARDIITNTEQASITAATDLAGALTAAAAVTTTGGYSIFNYGGDAYVLNNLGGQEFGAGDGLIKLTGVQVTDFTAQNLIA